VCFQNHPHNIPLTLIFAEQLDFQVALTSCCVAGLSARDHSL